MRKLLSFVLTFCIMAGFIVLNTENAVGLDDTYRYYQRELQKNIISTSVYHSMAVKADGTVSAWGRNYENQCKVPTGLTGVVAIDTGTYSSFAVKANGSVSAWGRNDNGMLSIPADLNNAVAIAAGQNHVIALTSNGKVVAWGSNVFGQCNVPTAALNNVVSIAAGDLHSLALRADGTIIAWGSNTSGQCTVPAGLNNVVAIDAGSSNSLALKSDGTVVAWGYNNAGCNNVPAGLNNVVAIAGGTYHTMALKADGTVVAWGGSDGQSTVPAGLSNAVEIAAGEKHSLALKADGTVVAWGNNGSGQCTVPAGLSLMPSSPTLADGANKVTVSGVGEAALIELYNSSGTKIASRVGNGDIEVPLGKNYYAKQIRTDIFPFNMISEASNKASSIPAAPILSGGMEKITVTGVKSNSLVKLYNSFGREVARRTGNGNFTGIPPGDGYFAVQVLGELASERSYPVFVDSLTRVEERYDYNAISTGYYHSMVLKSDGTVKAWGLNDAGSCDVPEELTDAVAVAGGGLYSMALKADGTIVSWGANDYSQCNVPAGLNNVVAIAAGAYHSLAIKSDRTIVTWGRNDGGQCDVPADLTDVVAISAGWWHSMALKSDGTVIAWGSNGSGQCTAPADLTNVVAIDAGGYHSLALKADGTVVAWGSNGNGESNIPEGLNNVVAIAGGHDYSVALKADGTVVVWGDNSKGQCNIPEGLNNVVAIDAGRYHILALKSDGTLVAWGDTSDGKCDIPEITMFAAPTLTGGAGKVSVTGAKTGFIVNLYNALGQKVASRIGNGDIVGVSVGNGYYVKQSLKGLTFLPLNEIPSDTANVSEASTLKVINKVVVGTPFNIVVEGKLGAEGVTEAIVIPYGSDGNARDAVSGAVEIETFAAGYSIIRNKATYNNGNGFNGEGFKVVRTSTGCEIPIIVIPGPEITEINVFF